jgi:hypothetical protein
MTCSKASPLCNVKGVNTTRSHCFDEGSLGFLDAAYPMQTVKETNADTMNVASATTKRCLLVPIFVASPLLVLQGRLARLHLEVMWGRSLYGPSCLCRMIPCAEPVAGHVVIDFSFQRSHLLSTECSEPT